ncbi:hypothetical protein EJ02DRAFT_453410 [Clathrospora elynae]|uniref:Uncharacterized protein n=1 Tax=Clathrospora elynae TaxID=706981 RepID=A0A6A5SXR4_9PLEO|nr:hypothetical protein EJ02DRAFT_453410 [Clathrospora elynae]
MASHNQPMSPPIRTNTVDSQKSQSSDQTSPTCSPASPTSNTFFGAITARIRGRSRSRSRGATSRKRSKSPMIMPPEHALQSQHGSIASPTRPAAVPVQNGSPNMQDTGRRSTGGSDPWRGRHSNDWLFNGYSVTATAKDLIQRRKS